MEERMGGNFPSKEERTALGECGRHGNELHVLSAARVGDELRHGSAGSKARARYHRLKFRGLTCESHKAEPHSQQ